MTNKAKDTIYRYENLPNYTFSGNYGLYIHVPFCFTQCTFCPYYKELVNDKVKSNYVNALILEIQRRKMNSPPKWTYIGGGTPNTLTKEELLLIFKALKQKGILHNVGMEVTPGKLDTDYCDTLKECGVKKLSFGVETFSGSILKKTGRIYASYEKIKNLTSYAQEIGLWVNADIMFGFKNQKIFTFREDIKKILAVNPNQITIYPVMTIRGTKVNIQTLDDLVEFRLIEEAETTMKKAGFKRKTLWTFGRDDGLYDSSYDELGSDYAGLGPSGITSTRGWVAVNLPLEGYIKNIKSANAQKAFVNSHVKTSAHEGWRKFGMMLYSRHLTTSRFFPFYLNLFIKILQVSGHSFFGKLTKKGLAYAHDITKAVVETKSFPIQYPGCIVNYNEYLADNQ